MIETMLAGRRVELRTTSKPGDPNGRLYAQGIFVALAPEESSLTGDVFSVIALLDNGELISWPLSRTRVLNAEGGDL